jgi:hypothetical protein
VRTGRSAHATIAALGAILALASNVVASTPGTDVRLTNDDPGSGGYVSDYTLVTGTPHTDATLTECSRSRGRENEPTVVVDPRNTQVLVGSSNDYCGVYNAGVDADGAPIPSGPIWLGYYRSENGGTSFMSSLVPGYPGDTSAYAVRAAIRTSSAGDPVAAWDGEGRLFMGSESSGDPAGTPKTFGDEWVATFVNPGGVNANTANDGKEFLRSVIVARGSSAPNLLGKFQDKTAIQADRTDSSCHDNVYFANSRFTGKIGRSNIYFYRSTNHGASFSQGTLLTTFANNVQDPDISVTANGHVYVSWDATLRQGNRSFDVIMYAKSVNCGATFAPERVLQTVETYTVTDIAQPQKGPSSPPDGSTEDVAAPDGSRRDCGDLSEHCASGFTYFREGTTTNTAADQYSSPSDESVYFVYHATIPGTEVATGNTFGSVVSGVGSQAGAYFVKLNGATGVATAPKLIDPTDKNAGQGHQIWPDISADGGVLHVIWYDSRNDPCYSPMRPIGNCADRSTVASLDTYGTRSTNGGTTFDASTRLSDVSHNPNLEQFTTRLVPFEGDYIWVTSMGSFSFGVWTDQRNAVAGVDQREGNDGDTDPGADVHQCRTSTGPGAFTGDTCPRAGGLDQNIYGDLVP